MLIPSRRRRPEPATPDRRRRRARSPVEALEPRRLLAATVAAEVSTPAPGIGGVALDADAPRVAFVQFQPLTGRVLVSIAGDLAGIDRSALTDPANYRFSPIARKDGGPARDPSRPAAGVILAPNFVVTGVALAPNPAPGLAQAMVVTINNNQPIRDGFYRFTIRSGGIADRAGNALDGEYSGVFPSGDGRAGGDFVAVLAVLRSSVQPALPVASAPRPARGAGGVKPSPVFFPTTEQVRIRIVGNNNRTSRLLGGGNAFARALPNQSYPGTFRLPEVVSGRAIRPVKDPAGRLR